jgi:ERCC4-type nuclease
MVIKLSKKGENMRFHYTDKEKSEIIKSIVVLIDTREQKNKHITDFFDKKKIKYKSKKLDFGDYSFYIPKNKELAIFKDIYFDKDIVVERKNSLDELAGNLTQGRDRLQGEFIRKQFAKMHLLIEDASWDDIKNHNYRSKYNPNSYLATLYCYMARYNISVDFFKRYQCGEFIYSVFHYFAREMINEHFEVIEE